jgi:hypothetical protein
MPKPESKTPMQGMGLGMDDFHHTGANHGIVIENRKH